MRGDRNGAVRASCVQAVVPRFYTGCQTVAGSDDVHRPFSVFRRPPNPNHEYRFAVISPGSDGALDPAKQRQSLCDGRFATARIWSVVIVCDDESLLVVGK